MKVFIVIVGLLFVSLDDLACSCGHVGIRKNRKEVDFVFRGKVTDVRETLTREFDPAANDSIDYRVTLYTFEVARNYKGLHGKETIELLSGMTDCEVRFDKGKTYIVYAYNDDRKLHYRLANQKTERYITTHLCTRTRKKSVLTFWESFILWVT